LLIPVEALLDLRRRLQIFPPRSHERRIIILQVAELYDISETTLYRALRATGIPKALRRSDRGLPRIIPKESMERYCELIAAIKVRTSNKKGRCLSTNEALRILTEYGIETPDGFCKMPAGILSTTTVNRYLRDWGYDRTTLGREPVAVRFQAIHSNDCWQFDLSPSDLKEVKEPSWVREGKGNPTLMLYSVVDDRSGVSYQEYHCVYGEDVEAALRFMFRAMSPKGVADFPFQGIPAMIYTDNGPIARSHVFLQVMKYLGIQVRTHMPAGKDGRRTTARAKGKVERPFRTVKEMHETLYHFHEPKDEDEANQWLMRFLLRYNTMEHRSEPHSRFEDWLQNLPEHGIREMCAWERFCTFAREPERSKVGSDARVTVHGTSYQVEPDLAGEEVILWWGLFDTELFIEHGERRFGPYAPVSGPIPLHRFRQFKKSRSQQRADRIENLAGKLVLPRSALAGHEPLPLAADGISLKGEAFNRPDPYREVVFPSVLAAKLAIADHLGTPLAKLSPEQVVQINGILNETLDKDEVFSRIRTVFTKYATGEAPC
jgi:hypothetical protein